MIELVVTDPDGATVVPPGADPCDPTMRVGSSTILDAVWCGVGPYTSTLRRCGLRPLSLGASITAPVPVRGGAWWTRRAWTLRRWGWWEPEIRCQALVDDRGGWPRSLAIARPRREFRNGVPYPRGGQATVARDIALREHRCPVIPGVFTSPIISDPHPDDRLIEWWGPVWLQMPQWWQTFLSWVFWRSVREPYMRVHWRHPDVALTVEVDE